MTITIDLMNVLYVVLAYLGIGYVVMLGVAAFEIYYNLRGESAKRKNRLMKKALYRAALFSWAFPYAVFDTARPYVEEMRRDRIRNSVFVNNENGEKLDYDAMVAEIHRIENPYDELRDLKFHYHGREKVLVRDAADLGYTRDRA